MNRAPSGFLFLLPLMVMVPVGCARYQYELVAPGDVAQPIDRGGVVVPFEPLEYEFADAGGRLYVRVTNPTDDVVELAGGRSYVVDPRGQSRSLLSGVIAPRSYIDFALPPSVPVVRAYPRYGFGFGFYGRRRGFGYPYGPYRRFGYDPFAGPPYDYDVGRAALWDWTTGEVRLHLAYRQTADADGHDDQSPPPAESGSGADDRRDTTPRAGTRRFEHEFVFLRRRVQ